MAVNKLQGGKNLDGKLVVLMGGSGFVGTHVAQALLERGARLRIAARHPEQAFKLKPLANLGQLQFVRCDATNEQSIVRTIDGADTVVNLIGSFDGDLMQLMGEAAGVMARAATETGTSAFVQISAIAANADSEAEYSRAKALGEKLVRQQFPAATILRPSIIFGEDDNFLNMFGGLIRNFPVLPVFAPDAELQLLYVDDLAEAVANALGAPGKYGGKTYELGGPEKLTMLEINRRIADAQGRKRAFIEMPDTVSGMFAALPGTPMDTDQWTMLRQGNVVSGEFSGIEKLGITPRPLGLFLDRWMTRYQKRGRFTGKQYEPV
ncbi:NADH:ubiquinone reductase (H(+)-translocating) [Alteripontixanthobacter maritimus]|uniref:NADH:ubiquinone reductase (H(+)-translocating) n=1 Tax=Alteripontixanthobacter maritimus TaxID=2161824 RepID=A0A369QF24_9SPHN|nr:complex I NDUFA9 subunit family protein [Alteripontixanthobacter maritimus]RDC60898.1 NADH:ubiquinone reductase (H(+)-translocating) [Alteripontixanthobacter maritimus]